MGIDMKKEKKQSPERLIPHYLTLITIIIIGFIVYHNSLKCGFVFDDNVLITDNPLIKNFSYIKDIFTTHLFHGSGVYSNFYRPIQSLSFMLDYHFWALEPAGYHIVNVLIHILNAIFVYYLIYLISKKQDIAIITSLLFCVHTVFSIGVYYISSRADLLAGFFFLISAILYILFQRKHGRGLFLHILSLFCFALSLLSKEVGLILPFILLFYISCFRREQKKTEKNLQSFIWTFLLILAIYIFLRSTVFNFAKERLLETTTGQIPIHLRLLTASKAFMIVLRLLLVPIGLHMEWSIEPATSFFQDEFFLSVVGLTVVGIFAYFLSRTSRLKFFFIGWFLIALIPHANIFPLNYFLVEMWLYIPSIGFFALLATYLSELKSRSRFLSSAVNCTVIVMVIFYGFLTVKRADVWAEPVKLYTEILRYSPENTKARINLGVILSKSGSDAKAMELYKEVVDLGDDAKVHVELGNIYANKGMYDQALEEFQKAVEINPNNFVAHNNIGIIYRKKGQLENAMEEYRKALRVNPNYPLTYNNIGNIYLDRGQYDTAIEYYSKAVNLDPNKAGFYENLGEAYKKKGMPQESSKYFEKASELKSDRKN